MAQRGYAGRRSPPAGPAVSEKLAKRIAMVGAFLPGRYRCLEQSLALLYCLRRCGVNAELRVGVQPYGFTAHAWVEVDGRPINEPWELVRKLVVFPTLLR